MKTIISNAIQILNENRGEMSIQEYHSFSKENDPSYFNWLFMSPGNINDYGTGMNQDQKNELKEFELVIEAQ